MGLVSSSTGRLCGDYFVTTTTNNSKEEDEDDDGDDTTEIVEDTTEVDVDGGAQRKKKKKKKKKKNSRKTSDDKDEKVDVVANSPLSTARLKHDVELHAVDATAKAENAKKLFHTGISSKSLVSGPTEVEHNVHVTVDPNTGEITNLPSEFRRQLYRKPQFGVPIDSIETSKVDGYKAPIPKILLSMQEQFSADNGCHAEGIFRISPGPDELDQALTDLQNRVSRAYDNPFIIATLMKRWFKQLPELILAPIEASRLLEACDSEIVAGDVVMSLPEPNQSVFLWLLDMLVDVDQLSDTNRMSARNLSVIWAPNLIPSPDLSHSDPTMQLTYVKKSTRFLLKAIVWRSKARPSRFMPKEFFQTDDLGDAVSYSDHPAYKSEAEAIKKATNNEKKKKSKSKKKKKSKRKLVEEEQIEGQ